MNPILSRLRHLPPPLVDGRATHCALTAVGGRICFTEPNQAINQRRRAGLRRRAKWLAGAAASLTAAARWSGPLRGAAGLAGAVFSLAAADGLGRDLGRGRRPHEYAVIDAVRGEVDLRAPDGWTITAPLHDVRAFLIVIDDEAHRCHLGMVMSDGGYLPWLTTHDPRPANALCWVFGHLTGIAALRLHGSLPLVPQWPAQAQPIDAPTPL
ncbi:MAG: hypothetical protein HZB16_00285 [Armatimonadetes bacterium]|nr:hypothetical protein [Armatimonadota bacterium]